MKPGYAINNNKNFSVKTQLTSLLLAVLLLLSLSAHAQINIPLHKGLRPSFSTEPLNLTMQRDIDNTRDAFRISAVIASKSTFNFQDTASINKDSIDKLTKKQLTDLDYRIKPLLNIQRQQATYATVAQLNKISRFQPIISAGVSNIFQNQRGNAVGSISLGLQYRATNFNPVLVNEDEADYKIDPHYLYVAWSTSTAKSDDSANVLKTIVFPELAKSDFIIGWHRDVIKGNILRGWTAELTFTTYKDSTNKYLSRSESLIGGHFWAFTGTIPGLNVPAGLKILAYGNVINIDPKYNRDLQIITNGAKLHNTFFNLGCRIQAEVNGANIFFNGKYILNPHGEVESPDLLRFVYTIGTLVSL
jgi:hypothetical protein